MVPLVCDTTGWFKPILRELHRFIVRPGSSSNLTAMTDEVGVLLRVSGFGFRPGS